MRASRCGARVALAFAVALGATWLCGCGSDGVAVGPTSRSHFQVFRVSEKALGPDQEFQLFRGPVEPVPSSVANKVPPEVASALDLAQRLPLVGIEAWIVPIAGRLCLLNVTEQGPAVGCKAERNVQREGIFIATVPTTSLAGSELRSVVGIAPDGVEAVRIQSKGARDRTALVLGNVFALQDDGKAFPESITFVRK